ncbi:NUDIX hydrolase [Thermotalea metallivorans]|uniref:Diadenosine hexaphosphate hydrolase n=1 Tax=Thermotalea metallivorans TaxID=520762 RepID=A0A140L0W4_9FIRM|nr:NUDIX hydrolase [Thermotalea metallivorans]KXG74189.1 Diadenosine hexaphosphate hydrolase [Thermotalea metallivorans]
MLFRNCAGGVVFFEDKVLLLKNEKDEWVLPKGVIRNGNLSRDVALSRVKEETGVNAEIVSPIGETCYEFYSITRQRPVCNEIIWYLMTASNDQCVLNEELGFKEVGFYPIDEAIEKITYSQDKSLVSLSYRKYKDLINSEFVV